jgi:uncharacterized membrane protein (Fun14 family)
MHLPIAMAVANATVEEVVKIILSNPDTAVKSFAVVAVQFLIGVAFGYIAVRALKYILALIGLTLLLSYITSLVSPVPIDINALANAAKALLRVLKGLANSCRPSGGWQDNSAQKHTL